ncbi:MAG TPA: carboxypeptidase regulatory-like domain-containing protein [Chlorobiota bacterium]|nr:carboxypeptidase regulatory-like domain-containing protein [Chlorobiota bacterium]
MNRCFFLLTIVLTVGLLAHTSVHGQGVTTGSMSGVVKDSKTQQGLSGATIKAVFSQTGAIYGTIARANGKYSIRGLRPGLYTVTVTYVGYPAITATNVRVDVGETVTRDFLMVELESNHLPEIVVTADKSILMDTSRTGAGSIISEQQITAAPTINRSISDMARMNPYATQSASTGGSFDATAGISVGGQNTRFNNFQIDGATANDGYGIGGAGTAGSVANNNFITLEAIEELKVNVSPYDVRQSGFTGGLINAITRGGTNVWRGSIFSYGRNEALVGLSPDANRRPFENFFDAQFGGRVGGPLIKDKLFLHVSAESRQRSTPAEVGLNDPNSLNNFPVPRQVIDDIATNVRNQYGYDPGQTENPTSIPNQSYNILTRIDWNIDEDNKLQFRHNLLYGTQLRNLQRTTTLYGFGSQANEFTTMSNQFVAQLNTIVGESIANEFRISVTVTNEERVNAGARFPESRIYVGSREAVVFGPDRTSQANALDQQVITVTDDISVFFGDHTITIGTHNELSLFNNLFMRDAYGAVQYADLASFQDSTPNYYSIAYANPALYDEGAFPRFPWKMAQLGTYVMDEWQVNSSLRFNGGLRIDVPVYLDSPLYNSLVTERFPGYSTSRLPSSTLQFSPRLGFNLDVSGDRSIIVRGGTGIFTGRVPAVWIGNQFANTGIDIFRAEVGRSGAGNAPIIDPRTNLPWVFDPRNPPVPGDSTFPGTATTQRSVINLTDENFRFPQLWRSTLGVDLRLLQGVTLTVEGMYGKNLNSVDYANINLRQNGISPLDGRPMYADASRADSLAAPEFVQVLLLRSRDEGYSYSASFQLNIDESNTIVPGLRALFSYTHMAAYDLNSSSDATALSQWGNTDAIDPNNATLGRSNFDVPHRVLANVSYTHTWTKDVATTIGIVYSGNSGRPYSLSYIQDYNGDNALGGNDLIYIPRREDYGTKVVVVQPTGTDLRTSDQVWEQIVAIVEANPILREYQGRILPRNSLREPWINRLDMRLTQRLPGLGSNTIDVTLDVENIFNLLGADLGTQQYVNFQSANLFGLSLSGGRPFDDQGRLRMSYSEPITNGRPGVYIVDNYGSRWRMQLGIRYNF